MLGRLNLSTWRSSTKIEALIEELTSLRKQDATTKSIVFSQFVNFLDLIAFRLQRAGFVVCLSLVVGDKVLMDGRESDMPTGRQHESSSA